jgi:hypothetical protein
MLVHQAADVGALSWLVGGNNYALEALREEGSMYELQKYAMIESTRVCANHWQTKELLKMGAVAGEGRWRLQIHWWHRRVGTNWRWEIIWRTLFGRQKLTGEAINNLSTK